MFFMPCSTVILSGVLAQNFRPAGLRVGRAAAEELAQSEVEGICGYAPAKSSFKSAIRRYNERPNPFSSRVILDSVQQPQIDFGALARGLVTNY
jgi:hypothetical protein